MGDRSAHVDEWLEDEFGEASAVVLKLSQLVGLNLAAQRGAVPPDEVMDIWLHAIADARIVAAQSEAGFIDAARAKGWPDERIADLVMVEPKQLDEHRDRQRALHLKIHPAVRRRQDRDAG